MFELVVEEDVVIEEVSDVEVKVGVVIEFVSG